MCTYCSTGDLHALWRAAGRFTEATVRLFAAELVLVLGEWGLSPPPEGGNGYGAGRGHPGSDSSILSPVYLHDLGIVHRDVKVGDRREGGQKGTEGLCIPWHGGPTPELVLFQMENILLDERGEGLVALAWGHPVHGVTPSSCTVLPPRASQTC